MFHPPVLHQLNTTVPCLLVDKSFISEYKCTMTLTNIQLHRMFKASSGIYHALVWVPLFLLFNLHLG